MEELPDSVMDPSDLLDLWKMTREGSLGRKLLVTSTGVVLSTTDANDDLDDGEESQLKGPIDLLAPYRAQKRHFLAIPWPLASTCECRRTHLATSRVDHVRSCTPPGRLLVRGDVEIVGVASE